MFNIPFFKRTSETFGLDIGSSAVKVVQLQGTSLVALAIAPLPSDVIADGTIKDPPTVVDAIRDAVTKAGVGSKEAAIGVSGREVIIKKVQIPEAPLKELRDAVQLEAEHHIPFAIDEVFLDYHVVGRHDATMDLILVAVKKSKGVEYVGVADEVGPDAVVVDVDGFARGNQGDLNQPSEPADAGALIEIAASVMRTNVLRCGTYSFARHTRLGCNTCPQAIAEQLKIGFHQPE